MSPGIEATPSAPKCPCIFGLYYPKPYAQNTSGVGLGLGPTREIAHKHQRMFFCWKVLRKAARSGCNCRWHRHTTAILLYKDDLV